MGASRAPAVWCYTGTVAAAPVVAGCGSPTGRAPAYAGGDAADSALTVDGAESVPAVEGANRDQAGLPPRWFFNSFITVFGPSTSRSPFSASTRSSSAPFFFASAESAVPSIG